MTAVRPHLPPNLGAAADDVAHDTSSGVDYTLPATGLATGTPVGNWIERAVNDASFSSCIHSCRR